MASNIQPYDPEQLAGALSRAQQESRQAKGDEDEEQEEVGAKKSMFKKLQAVKSVAKKFVSGMALKWLWAAFLPSFGLSFLLIDLLAFMHLVAPETFCEIGDEWEPLPNPFGHKIVEKIVFWFINAIIALVFIMILSLFIDISTAEQMKEDGQQNNTQSTQNDYSI